MKNLLHSNNLKATKPRLAVLDFLKKQKEPVSVEKIHRSLGSSIDIVTIYRNVDILKKKRMLFSENYLGRSYYYIAKSFHHHVVCRECGYKECLPCKHSFGNIKNFSDVSHELKLEGVCNKCSNS